ncbi:exosome complex component CSL4 [Bicyclus anynana]|uniref:Exosome complex component CSL4 n=1 Tax=Bicyclus anynana TaxID=110368 RepID=A0A6J1MWK9_BICAN|nr:exosome complex component CSL4 [Bicyclus anynana]
MDEEGTEKICIPGMRLSTLQGHSSGQGTYVKDGYIFAALSGILKTEEDNKVIKLSVVSLITPSILPKAGDIVTAKVNVVNSRQVQCVILCTGQTILTRPYKGIIKKEDIQLKYKDGIDPYKCFRPGDIVLAKVLPTTELHWYHLSTEDNELGVIIATAEGSPPGVSMIPINWSMMQCPKTLVKELRKVARVVPENINEALLPLHFNQDDESLLLNK